MRNKAKQLNVKTRLVFLRFEQELRAVNQILWAKRVELQELDDLSRIAKFFVEDKELKELLELVADILRIGVSLDLKDVFVWELR